jgi:hypothetical protein
VASGTPFTARGSLPDELDRLVVPHGVPRTSDIEFEVTLATPSAIHL